MQRLFNLSVQWAHVLTSDCFKGFLAVAALVSFTISFLEQIDKKWRR